MLIKTHLIVTLFFVLLLIPFVEYKVAFVLMAFLATYIPDIDSPKSKIGNHFFFRPFQWLANHRGMIHSFTFLFLVTLFFVFFFPILALGFFLGYSSHLFADSFTVEGIHPFYPSRSISNGDVRTGGFTERIVFVIFFFSSVALGIFRVRNFF